jgi:tetratricopeptide (TPR) repeat protein
LTGHPSAAELDALFREGLAPARARSVLRHLLRCESCLEAVPAPRLTPEQEAAYDAAIDRTFEMVLRHGRHLRRQEAQAKQIVKRLERGNDLEAAGKLPLTAGTYAKFRAFLNRSWALRNEDPSRMVQLALLALKCAERLDAKQYGNALVFDFQCEAQAAVGNAFRVADRLGDAKAAMLRAWELFELGTRCELQEVRLLDLEATLDVDLRRFHQAITKLETVYRYHRRTGDKHLAGRALLKQGLYTTYAGRPEKALAILRRSLTLLDATRDPGLVYDAMHNLVTALVDCRRYREAERQLFHLRPMQQHGSGRITRLKIRWEEGRIDAGLERYERAEAVLLEVREGLAEVNRAYDTALASLDLAAVLMARRKPRQAAEVVAAAYQTFVALRIEREGLASILVLRTACQAGVATRAMVEEVASFLRRFATDPTARFEGKAWKDEE